MTSYNKNKIKYTCSFIIFGAVLISTVIEGAVPFANRLSSPLVLEVPVEACERPMLGTLVLQKERTLLNAKFVDISVMIRQFRLHGKITSSSSSSSGGT